MDTRDSRYSSEYLPLQSGTQVLPAEENEIQRLLEEERMRVEEYKLSNHQLKLQHRKLQDDYMVLQTEMKSAIEESRLVHNRYKQLLEEARRDLSCKQAECEDLRQKNQAMPQNIERLKLQIRNELERPFQDKFLRLNQEVEKYRTDYNKVNYELTRLKAESERELRDRERTIQEHNIRHESESQKLKKERDDLLTRAQEQTTSEVSQMRQLQRDNAQLHQRVTGLLAELEDAHVYRQTLGLQSESVSRVQQKQLGEQASVIRTLQSDNESAQKRCECLEKELDAAKKHQTHLLQRIADLEKDNMLLVNRVDESHQKSQLDVANAKIEAFQERGELERDRDKMKAELQGLRAEIEMLNQALSRQEEILIEKEKDTMKRIQATKEEEWQKQCSIECQRLELESKLTESERKRHEMETGQREEIRKMEQQQRKVEDCKETLERDLNSVRAQLHNQQLLLDQLEREKAENLELKRKLNRLEMQYTAFVASEQELLDFNQQLKTEATCARDQFQRLKDEMVRSQEQSDVLLSQTRAEAATDRANLEKRVSDQDEMIKQLNKKLIDNMNEYNQKKHDLKCAVSKLTNEVTLLQGKVQRLESERQSLLKSIPEETYQRLRNQLLDLLKRHREFRRVLLTSGYGEMPADCLSFTGDFPQHSRHKDHVSYSQTDLARGSSPPRSTLHRSQGHMTRDDLEISRFMERIDEHLGV